MRVEVVAFAALREALGAERIVVEVAEGATGVDLRARVAEMHPRWRDLVQACRLARGTEFVDDRVPLAEGAESAPHPAGERRERCARSRCPSRRAPHARAPRRVAPQERRHARRGGSGRRVRGHGALAVARARRALPRVRSPRADGARADGADRERGARALAGDRAVPAPSARAGRGGGGERGCGGELPASRARPSRPAAISSSGSRPTCRSGRRSSSPTAACGWARPASARTRIRARTPPEVPAGGCLPGRPAPGDRRNRDAAG